MIIKIGSKSPITRSDKPNENWTGDQTYFIINDNSTLGKKVLEYAPYYEEMRNSNGDLIDITPTERPTPPPPAPTETEILQQTVADLESQNTDLMLAIAEMAEATEQSKTETQIAIAELAEIIAGGA